MTLLGPTLVVAGFALYMAANVWLGRFRRVPWEFLTVSAAGALLSLSRAFTAPSGSTVVAAGVSVVLSGLLVWFFFSFSMYGPREDRPRVGDRFPDFRLPASDGEMFDSATAGRNRRLLIFYRGSW